MSRKWQRILAIMLLDILIIAFTGWFSLFVRFDFRYKEIPLEYLQSWKQYLPYQIGVTVLIFFLLRMYHFIWHLVTASDAAKMVLVVTGTFAVNTALHIYFVQPRLPISVYFGMLVLQIGGLCGIRCAFRFMYAFMSARKKKGKLHDRIMLIGAGSAGSVILRELTNEKVQWGVCVCIIDDNPNKWGQFLSGVRIVGGRDKIEECAKSYHVDKIIFAAPSADTETRREILTICTKTGCEILIMPTIGDMLDAETVKTSQLKSLRIEDLLGRDPIQLDTEVVNGFIRGKTVLVTGGGGSIGSELCRQIAANSPKKLIILDIYENNAYDIQQELIRTWGKKLDMSVEIASVRDREKIYHIFSKYLPNIVFHAAAHKHVPLMENNPEEAVKNNIFGTYHVVRAAEKYGVQKFVMISTDKAVNPTNVMGATKRFCEMILQSRRNSITEFCSVRFGNVLGSNGSVVPLFEKQIAAGGPITITDKRITRFFMTIPEAVQLVLEAGAIAEQNQIFVLDMGKPVTILSLAENMIRLHGLEPYKDIDIVEIGLRPGEKLYEELLMASEHLTKMSDKIFVEEQTDILPEKIHDALEQLDVAVTEEWSEKQVTELLHEIIPTFKRPEDVNMTVAAQNN